MAQNFLYLMELVVDELLISRPNCCAPEEYPTCCEINFRSIMFISICDRDYGNCVDLSSPKCGKCCLFAMDTPISDKDRLLVNVYKKKNDLCKFLLGTSDLAIKSLFDKVTEEFNIENPKWEEKIKLQLKSLPNLKSKKSGVIDMDVDDCDMGRPEQFCMTSQLVKHLLPLFNTKRQQTGNIVLIIKLICNGPAIVSSIPYAPICPELDRNGSNAGSNGASGKPGVCQMPDPCRVKEKKNPIPQRYFSTNAVKGCPYEECQDECDRECPSVKPVNKSKCPTPSFRPKSPCCQPKAVPSCRRPPPPPPPSPCCCQPQPNSNGDEKSGCMFEPEQEEAEEYDEPSEESSPCDRNKELEAAKAKAMRKIKSLMKKSSKCP